MLMWMMQSHYLLWSKSENTRQQLFKQAAHDDVRQNVKTIIFRNEQARRLWKESSWSMADKSLSKNFLFFSKTQPSILNWLWYQFRPFFCQCTALQVLTLKRKQFPSIGLRWLPSQGSRPDLLPRPKALLYVNDSSPLEGRDPPYERYRVVDIPIHLCLPKDWLWFSAQSRRWWVFLFWWAIGGNPLTPSTWQAEAGLWWGVTGSWWG